MKKLFLLSLTIAMLVGFQNCTAKRKGKCNDCPSFSKVTTSIDAAIL